MRAPTDLSPPWSALWPALRRLVLGLGTFLAAAGSCLAVQNGSPYRLNIPMEDYKLRLDDETVDELVRTAARGKGKRRKHEPLEALIERHARARGLDPDLVHALIRAESGYQTEAISAKGAIGLMQVMPDTAKRFGVTNLMDPEANLKAGTAYLSFLLDLFDDLPLALAAYNAGEGAVIRHGRRIPPYAETQAYVQDVLRHYGKGKARVAVKKKGKAVTRVAKGKGRLRLVYEPGARVEGTETPYRLRRQPASGG